jgi:hypothetical protein
MLSGEVSGESPVVCPASSASFYFMDESFFATLKQKRNFFLLPGSKKEHVSAREAEGWEIKSPMDS